MKVYVVVSNNADEVIGEIEGVFKNFEDAKKCLEGIKKEWLSYADEVVNQQESEDSFSLETSYEFMDVSIVTKELQ